jgi:hypothetical protein
MACCLQVLSRFVPSRFAPPRSAALPASRVNPTHEHSQLNARGDTATQQTTLDFVPEGIPGRVLRLDYPSPPGFRHSTNYFLRICQPLQGFQDCHVNTYIDHITLTILQAAKVEFDTEANAARAAARLLITNANDRPSSVKYFPELTEPVLDGVYSDYDTLLDLSSLTTMDEAAITQPPRKKAKLDFPLLCRICANEITGAYSKPCLRCKKAWCLDCVKTWFTLATTDFERMPARCCNMVMHHGVAGAILSTVELESYKLRYDEHTTANPLYCPVPTCSTFIPPRLIDSTQSTVNCTVCTTRICTKCKQLAATDHACEEEAAVVQIKAFNYKICPKCGTGVMKMYGCPHVRCACGAHVCWDCMRALAVCYRSPCASAIEDGQYGDEEDDVSTDSEEGVEDVGTIMNISSDARQAQPASAGDAQVDIAGIRRGAHAMLNIFRGRRRRGGEGEERRRNLPPIAQVEGEMRAENEALAIAAAEDASSLEMQAATTLTSLAASSAAPPDEAAPLGLRPLNLPDSFWEHEDLGCTRGDLHGSIGESSNVIIGPPTEELTEQQAPLSDTAALASTASADPSNAADTTNTSNETVAADTTVPSRPPSILSEALALSLPFAASSNTDLNESSFATRPNPAVFPSTVTPPTPPIPNLDDPTLLNWETEPLDFGNEPIDEAFDVWGCACTFTRLKKSNVDEHWMDLQYLDCMKCFAGAGEMVLFSQGPVRRSEKERGAWHCFKCGVVVCGKCAREKKGRVKEGMRGEGGAGLIEGRMGELNR